MEWKQSKLPEEYELFNKNGYSKFESVALCKAGIKTLEEAKEHLFGNELNNPGEIRDIETAAEIIWKHIHCGNKICIFGDFDTDGITASAISFSCSLQGQ